MHHNIPFTTFRGTLKQHRLTRVDAIHARLFYETFPRFFANPEPPVNGAEMKRQVESLGPRFAYREETELRRRFAGEPTLRRGCYYTVCRSASGDDDGTLQNEVRAYRDPLVSGPVYVSDLRLTPNPFTGEHRNALFVTWATPKQSRLAQELLKLKPRPDEQQVLALEFPYEVMNVTLDNVVDLRYPHVREWFYKTFSTEQEDGTILWMPRRIHGAIQADRDKVEALCITRPSRFRVESRIPPIPANFAEMLPTLMNPDLGGGGAADSGSSLQAIGTWMRHKGVAALIYPSARSDVSVDVVDRQIKAFSGWNLVDYRNDRPRGIIPHYIEQSPWCWTGFSPGIQFQGENHGYGSFRIVGVEGYWHRDYKGILEALDALQLHCRDEALFESGAKLTIIGAWRLGAASIEWLRQNAVEKNEAKAIKERDLFKGCLLRLKEMQKVGLIDELSVTLAKTQNLARGITDCMDFVDDLARSLTDAGSDRAAGTLVLSNRLHVLRFFVSAHALALKAGWPVARTETNAFSLVNDFDARRTGLSVPVQESIAALFSRGLGLMAAAESKLADYERWLIDVGAIELNK
jgi:hypothetical protein